MPIMSSSSASASSYYPPALPDQHSNIIVDDTMDNNSNQSNHNHSNFQIDTRDNRNGSRPFDYTSNNNHSLQYSQNYQSPSSSQQVQNSGPLTLPQSITTTAPKSIPSPMAYSPIAASSSLHRSQNSQTSLQNQSLFNASRSDSTSEYPTSFKSQPPGISASSSATSISSSPSMNSVFSAGAFPSPSITHSQSYSSGLTAHQQQQQQKSTMSPGASMNPYSSIPEEPTGSPAVRYPHHSHTKSNSHYRQPSLQLSHSNISPVSNPNAPASTSASEAALTRASYGSASSLMSFEGNSALSNNVANTGSLQSQQQAHQRNSPNKLHFNPHSSPCLQNITNTQGYSTLDPNSNSAYAPSPSTNLSSSHSRNHSSSLSPAGSKLPANNRSMQFTNLIDSSSVAPAPSTFSANASGSTSSKPLTVDTASKPAASKHLLSPLFTSQQQQQQQQFHSASLNREDTSPPKNIQTSSSPQILYHRSSRQNMSAQQSALMAATSQHRNSSNALDAPQASDMQFRNSTGSHNTVSSMPSSSSTNYYAPAVPPMLGDSSALPMPTNSTQLNQSTPPSLQHFTPVPVPPSFHRVCSKSDLVPVIHDQPKYRRALPEGGTLSPLAALTKQLSTTYHICNPEFNYQSSKNPRRILTKPSEGAHNNGYDNVDSDYILYVNDILGVDEKRRYLVLDILGHGTFGQVAKCQNMITKEILAVKVIKSKPAYLKQSMMEVSILDHLNNQVDKNDEHNLLRFKDRFMHKNHLCLVFELLSSNLYELIKRNQFRGLSTGLVRVFAQQLLDSLKVLKDAKIIHCDLKPENILLKSLNSPVIKVIDFGSACHELQTVYTYIQSRFYRSPEVLLGLPYTSSIDMWSLGCIVAELFLGLPIFPGTSEYNQISRIVDTLGIPPKWMIEMGKASFQFMELQTDEYGRKKYGLKSREKYSEEFQTKEEPSKQYFPSTNLDEIIMNYPLPRQRMSQQDIQKEMSNRESFLDFVKGLLNMNPFERWTPHQAAMHPFITEKKYTGPFVSNLAMKNYGERPSPNPNTNNTTMEPNATQQSHSTQQGSYVNSQQSQQASLLNKNDPQTQTYYGSTINTKTNANTTGGLSNSGYGVSQKNMGYQPSMQMSQPSVQSQSAAQSMQPKQQQPPAGHQQQFQQRAAAASSWTTRRPRATTIGNMDPIPPPIQRATALMNPTQPIRSQDSPAYFPPPELAGGAQHQQQRQLNNNNTSSYGSSGNAFGNAGNASSYQGGSMQQQNSLNVAKTRQQQQPMALSQHQQLAQSGLSHSMSTYGSLNSSLNNGALQQQMQMQQNIGTNPANQGNVKNLDQSSTYWNQQNSVN